MMNQKVEEYLRSVGRWQKELKQLRKIILDCGLIEDYKWKHPCYTLDKKNIVLIHEFKDYCAIDFFKGALLKDLKKILVQQTENVQAERQIRFKSLSEIENLESTIRSYILEAMEIEKAGLKVKMKRTSDFDMPEELKQKFEANTEFKRAFENLTQGRQRGYLLHFSKPKQSETRHSRIEKNMERIFNGKGLTDCVCGHSKRMPNCDGSHKFLN